MFDFKQAQSKGGLYTCFRRNVSCTKSCTKLHIDFVENFVKGKFTANHSTSQPEEKFYRKGKTFDINLCCCQHLVKVLVKVKSDLKGA